MKKTIYVIAGWNKYSKTFDYSLSTWKPAEDSESVLVCEREVEFESLAEAELKQRIYDALHRHRKSVLADAYAEAVEIEAMANELLAIEYKPEESNDD